MVDVLFSGLMRGGMYILIAIGLQLVYGVMRIPNFAHGEYYVIGAYAAYFCFNRFQNPVLAIILSIIVGFVVGALVEIIVFRNLRKRNVGDWVMNTFMIGAGIQLIIQNVTQLLFGANYFGVTTLWKGNIKLGSFSISMDRAVAFIVAVLAVVLLWVFLKKTRTGNAILAVSEHGTGARLMGVNTRGVYTLTYALSCMLAALAGGALIAISPAYPTAGIQPQLAAWFVVVLVGLGNIEGVIVGGFIVGMIEVFATYYVGSAWQNAISLSMIILVLIFKPSGLFGKKVKV